MTLALPFALAVLILAGGVLIWEARTGRFASESPEADRWRGVLFFLATAIGSALLIRSAGGSLLLAFALLPVTLLSLIRFVTLARRRWTSAWSTFALAAALVVGTLAGFAALPGPSDHDGLLEQIFYPDHGTTPDSIDPDAGRPVRL